MLFIREAYDAETVEKYIGGLPAEPVASEMSSPAPCSLLCESTPRTLVFFDAIMPRDPSDMCHSLCALPTTHVLFVTAAPLEIGASGRCYLRARFFISI